MILDMKLKLITEDELPNDVDLRHEQKSNFNHYGWLGIR